MSNITPKIVVVTPVKNESWILDRFLSVTSQFADHIIIADQCSTDDSVDICRKYAKVTVFENKSEKYDEAERQIALLKTARELVPEHKIILALDADELLAADATSKIGWQTMLRSEPGTVLCFEKPDLYVRPDLCIRYDIPWPIGYVDDGAEHKPRKIHSIRIPLPPEAPRLYLHDVKFLHYRLTRPAAEAAKFRMYSVLENVNQLSPLRRRRIRYADGFNHLSAGRLEPTPTAWFSGWEEQGIDMHTITCYNRYWYDQEVLSQLLRHGSKRFWGDDIWNYDWNEYHQQVNINHKFDAETNIQGPPFLYKFGLSLLDWADAQGRSIKNTLLPGKVDRGWR
jgi:glycosyltransferase involved in cell wall biosynthesis